MHQKLHSLYFRSLVDIVVNRAELIGTERHMMKVQTVLLGSVRSEQYDRSSFGTRFLSRVPLGSFYGPCDASIM